MNDKSSLRKHFLSLRETVSLEAAEQAGRVVALLIQQEAGASGVAAGYVAFRGEINCFTALESLAQSGWRLQLPLVDKAHKLLKFVPYAMGDELVPGMFGILEPAVARETEDLPDLLLVPCLAVDNRGYRLGYGGGFYDRTLPLLRQVKPHLRALGVAYSSQQVEALPAEPTDQRLDGLITEQGFTSFR